MATVLFKKFYLILEFIFVKKLCKATLRNKKAVKIKKNKLLK